MIPLPRYPQRLSTAFMTAADQGAGPTFTLTFSRCIAASSRTRGTTTTMMG